MKENCPLCDAKDVCVANRSHGLDMYEVGCSICGDYSISGLERLQVSQLSKEDLAKLRAVVKERSLKGLPAIMVAECEVGDSGARTIAQILAEYPKNASDMMNRAMVNLSVLAGHPCDEVGLEISDYPLLFGRDINDARRMLQLLESMDWVEKRITSSSITVSILAEGWSRVEELKQSNSESRQAFVAMWFSEETGPFWRDGLKPPIEEAGDFVALRIDQQEHNQKICDQIIAEIRKSRFVVADFTGNRGGVYYEAGFAQGLGIPVIWTVRKDWLKEVHFDTRQYNHIPYETPSELCEALKNRIMATIPGIQGRR